MRVKKEGLYQDNPAAKLLDWLGAYEGVTTANGNVAGTTLICADLVNHADYSNAIVKVLDTAAAGQVRRVVTDAAGTLTVFNAFTDALGAAVQIVAGTRFIVLSLDESTAVAILAALAVPAPDAVANLLERDVIGNKASTEQYTPGNTSDLVRYAKALVRAGIAVEGAVVAGVIGRATFDTNLAEATTNHYNGGLLMFITGPNARQAHVIDFYFGATRNVSFALNDQWTDVPAAGNQFIIIPSPGAYLKKTFDLMETLSTPREEMIETWQMETGIDAARWLVTNPATGAPWTRGAIGARLRATSVPAANEVARLAGQHRWVFSPTLYGYYTIYKRLILEFEMRLTNVANMDNAVCVFGWTPTQVATRATPNIAVFGLAADVLETVTDLGGVETVDGPFGETLTDWNKFRIDAYLNTVVFSLNEAVIATHVANLPDQVMYPMFYVDTEAGGPGTPEIGPVRIWYEYIARH